MQRHWTLDDIPWHAFAPEKVDPDLLRVVKAAAMVEFNSRDYVTYLCNVFADDAAMQDAARRWGEEEVQHGDALAAWARLADPGFDFDAAFARFRAGYSLPLDATASVRGSRAGELVARCVVEVGTSSFYTALRDASEEPVLKAIAGRIASDEFRHYKLFYDRLQPYAARERPSRLFRLRVALGRLREVEDDELAFAYYCGNVADPRAPYRRKVCSRAYAREAGALYRRRHVARAAAMIAKAAGLRPQGWPARLAGHAAWGWLAARRRLRPA